MSCCEKMHKNYKDKFQQGTRNQSKIGSIHLKSWKRQAKKRLIAAFRSIRPQPGSRKKKTRSSKKITAGTVGWS